MSVENDFPFIRIFRSCTMLSITLTLSLKCAQARTNRLVFDLSSKLRYDFIQNACQNSLYKPLTNLKTAVSTAIKNAAKITTGVSIIQHIFSCFVFEKACIMKSFSLVILIADRVRRIKRWILHFDSHKDEIIMQLWENEISASSLIYNSSDDRRGNDQDRHYSYQREGSISSLLFHLISQFRRPSLVLPRLSLHQSQWLQPLQRLLQRPQQSSVWLNRIRCEVQISGSSPSSHHHNHCSGCGSEDNNGERLNTRLYPRWNWNKGNRLFVSHATLIDERARWMKRRLFWALFPRDQ